MKQYFCVITLFLAMTSGHAQNSTKDLFHTLDSKQGFENLSILNGVAYKEQFRTINDKHSFYKGRDFYSGALDYDGEEYSNVQLRYDMFTGDVIVSVKGTGQEQYIYKLIPDLLEGFTIEGHKYVKLEFPEGDFDPGYFEALHEFKDVTIYKKQNFRPYQKRDRNVAYYEFERTSTDYLLRTGEGFYKLSSSDLEVLYPKYENQISDYFKANRSTRKRDYENFLRGLGRLIQDFESATKQQD